MNSGAVNLVTQEGGGWMRVMTYFKRCVKSLRHLLFDTLAVVGVCIVTISLMSPGPIL